MTETVIAAAVQWEDLTISLPQPARHHNIMHDLYSKTGRRVRGDEQGFLTSTGRFVGREQAFQIAHRAGQFDPENRLSGSSSRDLFSEDLW